MKFLRFCTLCAAACIAGVCFGHEVAPAATSQPPATIRDDSREAAAMRAAAATEELRAQIAEVERNLATTVDKGAALYFLALGRQQLGDTQQAHDLLRRCLSLQEGFDPSGSASLQALAEYPDLRPLVKETHDRFPVVANAHLAFQTKDGSLMPEGLAYDAPHRRFYLGSLNRRTILSITRAGLEVPFARSNRGDLLPILGIRADAAGGAVWAASWDETTDRSELLHFDDSGKLLARHRAAGGGRHGFNDLVIARDGAVFVTDSAGNRLVKFDPRTGSFTVVPTHRALSYPNGITFGRSEDELFVADEYGIVRLTLNDAQSRDVHAGPHNTVVGIDGLYWHKGSLVAVQNGIGSARIVSFHLAVDELRVLSTTVLENRTSFTLAPTTGAIVDDDFYFICNSQDSGPHAAVRIAVLPLRGAGL